MTKFFLSVYDAAAGAFLDAFLSPSIEFGIREFRRVVNEQGHQFNTFPEDYTLFHVGEWDQKTGKIKAIDPVSLGAAITFKQHNPYEQQSLFNGNQEDNNDA